jgi:hypothetical protein
LYAFGLVIGDPVAILIARAKMILRRGITLLSSFYVPTYSVNFISFYTKTLVETACEQPLCFTDTELGGLGPFREAFVKTLAYVRPTALAFGDGTFTLTGIDDAGLAQSLDIILTNPTLWAKPGVVGNPLLALETFHKTALPI